MSELRAALVSLLLMTLLTGVAYPLLVTGIAQAAFPHQANGSLVHSQDTLRGSELVGQPFDAPKYFWSRPSGTSPAYNAGASSGSNLGPLNPELHAAVKARVEALRAVDPGNTSPVPIELVTASGSGLDPHLSPAAALYQVARVAKQRGLSVAAVTKLVERHTQRRAFGVLGEATVNVLLLNLALDGVKCAKL